MCPLWLHTVRQAAAVRLAASIFVHKLTRNGLRADMLAFGAAPVYLAIR